MGHLAHTTIRALLLAALYVLLARLGLTLATIGHSVTLVWPPTGLALAALFLYGRRLWPGVLLGALVVNALTPGVPMLSACGMAVGNTAEALLGAHLLRISGFGQALRRGKDVLKFLIFAGLLSTAVSATLGPLSLWFGGVIPGTALLETVRVWWLGDLMGALIVAPLLLVWLTRDAEDARRSLLEGMALLILLLTMSALVFGRPLIFPFAAQPYAIFPLLIWAALRFGPRGSVTANFVISSVSVWATVGGQGPFARALLNESLVLLQTFMAIAALTSLILGAIAAERFDATRTREDFISIASHEIRTPLTSLQLQIQRLRRVLERNPNVAPPTQDISGILTGILTIVERQIARLSGLAEVLLDLTRLRTGDLTLNPERIDLVGLLRETIQTAGSSDASTASSIQMRASDPVFGHWDRLRIQQVLANLVSNAMKYGAGQPILITVGANADTAFVEVQDHGPGIEKRDQKHIFRRFERRTTDRDLPGLGLGLHIAREIVEAHQGRIHVNSRPGQGSTFTVRLPRRPARTGKGSPIT